MRKLANDIAEAVLAVDGVIDIADDRQKGIRISNSDTGLCIDLHVILKFGMSIPETAWQLQQRVKETVAASDEDYGGSEIEKIDVTIRGIQTE